MIWGTYGYPHFRKPPFLVMATKVCRHSLEGKNKVTPLSLEFAPEAERGRLGLANSLAT